MQIAPTLRVAGTSSKLVGHGIAVIDPQVINELDLSAGDTIQVSGKKKESYALL